MNKKVSKAISVMLAFTMILALFGCTQDKEETTTGEGDAPESTTAEQIIYDAVADKVVKAETVYVNLDAAGTPSSIIVSDWLHTNTPCVKVTDKSDSTGIVNVKGTELPVYNADTIEWNMSSTDLYYRGYSNKPLPVDISIKYYLNGTEIPAADIKGRSGEVKIEITMTNKSFETVNISGTDVKVYNPLVVIGGMILPEAQFTNIELTNGKTIGDGSKEIALMVGLPGMAETLGLDTMDFSSLGIDSVSGINLTNTYTITAEATDCSLGNMYFAVMPLASIDASLDLDSTLSDVKSTLSSVSDLVNTIYSLDAKNLIDTLMGNSDRVSGLVSMIGEASELYKENKALLDVLSKYLTDENMNMIKALISDLSTIDVKQYSELLNSDAVTNLMNDLNKTDLSKYESLLKNPLFKAFFSDISGLMKDFEEVKPAIDSISKSVTNGEFDKLISDVEAIMPVFDKLSAELSEPDAAKAINNMPATLDKLSSLLSKVEENKDIINSLMTLFSEDNINSLTTLLSKTENLNIDAIMDIAEKFTSNADNIVDRAEEMINFGKKNTIYSAASDGMETSVMYVYQTPGV